MRFNATIEFLSSTRAILTLTHKGEWSGSHRIDLTKRNQDLYELGYTHACQNAAVKGGTIDTYRVVQ